MTTAVSELSVPVPWGEIKGRVWGPDHGRPVLCLHGWADNCGSFNTLIPLLPKEFRYVAVDLAGHGLSSHPPPGVFYCLPPYVMDVRRVVDALQWPKFSLIGHSVGGNIAAMFSSLYPEMVAALVLLDSCGYITTDVKETAKMMRQGLEEMRQFENQTTDRKRIYTYDKAVKRLLDAGPTLSEKSAHILLERGLVQVEGGFVFSRDLRVNFKNIVRLTLEQSLEMLSRIQACILVVKAEASSARILTQPLLKALQAAKHMVVTVPGDHHVHLSNPEKVAPHVSDFLQTKVLSRSDSLEEKQKL
ncbi:serine hydrolase-like protein [Thalassophryne amazonica]|uniref:serine hydrolase-like protein n=1 Tax=Thalassophryne amazonica TaxID=390379 RepID=UPI001471D85B|nr:serine hydrolase-like protein [Thalassophryne amazonica]